MSPPNSSKGPPLPANAAIDASLDTTAFFDFTQVLNPTTQLQSAIATESHPTLPMASIPGQNLSNSLPISVQELYSRQVYLDNILRLSMASGGLLCSSSPSQAHSAASYTVNDPKVTQSNYVHQNWTPNPASPGPQMCYYNLVPQNTGQTVQVPFSSPSAAYGSPWIGPNVSLPSVVAPKGQSQLGTYPLQQGYATYPPSPADLDSARISLPTHAPNFASPGPPSYLDIAAMLPPPTSSTTVPSHADQEYTKLLEQVLKYEANNQFMHFGGVYRQRMRGQCSTNMQTEFSEKLSSFWKASRPVERELFNSKRLLEKWWINDAQHVIRQMLGKMPEKNKKPDNEVMLYAPIERVKFVAASKHLSTSNPWYNDPTDPTSGSIPPAASLPSHRSTSSKDQPAASLDQCFHPKKHLRYEPPRHPRDASLSPEEIDHAFDRWMAEQGADHLTYVVHMELMNNPAETPKSSGDANTTATASLA
ncbi:hypothetical protein H4R34_000685 [Dimargaris verticillata]|uniref:Uncharacterized protein n=1 Tax=Dimargaris verticillata TaxID=2761393 RepID=A0A9W8EEF9_9FUNG|nr:hypothetical protein H4R34_000685 [Dimargaris verticillata]